MERPLRAHREVPATLTSPSNFWHRVALWAAKTPHAG